MLPELATARLRLRPAGEADLDRLWALWRDPEVRRFLFDDQTVGRERAAAALADCRAALAQGLGLWCLERRDAAGLAGCAGLLPVGAAGAYLPELREDVEVLIALAPAHWHQGYAGEALARVVAYGFEELGLARLVAIVDLPNQASHRVVRRLGFEPLGDGDGPCHPMRSYALRPGHQ